VCEVFEVFKLISPPRTLFIQLYGFSMEIENFQLNFFTVIHKNFLNYALAFIHLSSHIPFSSSHCCFSHETKKFYTIIIFIIIHMDTHHTSTKMGLI
jgi:hypothetical protein